MKPSEITSKLKDFGLAYRLVHKTNRAAVGWYEIYLLEYSHQYVVRYDSLIEVAAFAEGIEWWSSYYTDDGPVY
jgi:hypothetical protein